MSTLGSIAAGIDDQPDHPAADVHLKERRKLILVPRETPLSLIHLENMVKVTRAGAVVLPAMPGWYHRPRQLRDLIDFVVARICDQIGIPNALCRAGAARQSADPLEETEAILGSTSKTPRSTSKKPSETRSPETEPMAIDAGPQGRCRPRRPDHGRFGRPGCRIARELARQQKAGALVLTARRGDRLGAARE